MTRIKAVAAPPPTLAADGMTNATLTLFLAGDVMTGRGIDQILPHPGAPELHEAYAGSALEYVALGERRYGRIDKPVDFAYVWGAAIAELTRRQPGARFVNLETAVTTSSAAWPGKGIHYRMHPANAAVLSAAGIDACTLANNHVLDWGPAGLDETLRTLQRKGIRHAGAGRDQAAAAAPAAITIGPAQRVLVFGACTADSGVWPEFAATASRGGVNLLPDLSPDTSAAIAREVKRARRAGDLVVVSIHWGDNWGYAVARDERAFAHRLIDEAGVDVVHGHSSHHAKGIEVYRGRLVLYGCGDFVNDYEGIGGHEAYRADLRLMYFPTLDAHGNLVDLTLVPLRTRRFRLEPASDEERRWLLAMLEQESAPFGAFFRLDDEGLIVWTPTGHGQRDAGA